MWVPVALSRDVPFCTTRAVVVDGEELMVWRAADGAVQVWEDRCPHRGMRLSLGFVRGNELNCLYHGWTYEAGATCVRIPAHPNLKVPPTIKANAYPVREAGGMIWTAVGDVAERSAVHGATAVASLAVEVPASVVLGRIAGERLTGMQLIIATLDEMRFQIGWHVVSTAKTMLHAALRSAHHPNAALPTLHRLRDSAERAGAA